MFVSPERDNPPNLASSTVMKQDQDSFQLAANEDILVSNGSSENRRIAARTFTFRELAAATSNFRVDCLLGEGGFGRVYKGYLETVDQASNLYSASCYHTANFCLIKLESLQLTV